MSNGFDYSDLKILLVDDEDFVRALVKRLLNQIGIEQIHEADNGIEALKILEASGGEVDLVLCDLDMPQIGGLRVIEGIRKGIAGDAYKDMPIIILTGHIEKDLIEKAVLRGIQAYLVKPVDQKALEKSIRSSLHAPTIDPVILYAQK